MDVRRGAHQGLREIEVAVERGALGEGAPEVAPLTQAAREAGVPVEVHELHDSAVARAYERALVLVRPDGHVAWRGDALPADTRRLIETVAGQRI